MRCDAAALSDLGVAGETQRILLAGVPPTVTVSPEQAERFWSERKRWFFKPPAGFGGRAAYRGDKLTKRVFEEILHGGYIAQEIAPPSEHLVAVGDGEQRMKADIRCLVYDAASRWSPPASTRARPPISGRRAAVSRRCSSPEQVKFRHESIRHRRLFRLRQDDAAGKADPAIHRPRPQGFGDQARPSRLRHRPPGQGLLPPPRCRCDRGDALLQRPLGADARAA